MKILNDLYFKTSNLVKIGIMGFLIALIGVVAPTQIVSLLIYNTFHGTAYAGFFGMFIASAMFFSTAIPISIIIIIIGFRYVYKFFKSQGIKNFNWFLICFILFLILVYPATSPKLPSVLTLWFGYQSLYLFPLLFVINYLIFGKMNIPTKYLGTGTMSFIIWFAFSIVTVSGCRLTFKLYDSYMIGRVEREVSKLEIIQDPKSFIKNYTPSEPDVSFNKNSDGFEISPLYPYKSLVSSDISFSEAYTDPNGSKCNIHKYVENDVTWKVFWAAVTTNCYPDYHHNKFYGPYRYPDNYPWK